MNDYRAYVECDYNSIYHHGIKGQKWGVRRYQNEDGTRTEAGKKRYGGFHIHFDPISWVAGIASKNSGERLTSIKVAGDKDNGDSLFIDSLLFIPYNVAKRSINHKKERQKLLENVQNEGGKKQHNDKFHAVDVNGKRYLKSPSVIIGDAIVDMTDDMVKNNRKNRR